MSKVPYHHFLQDDGITDAQFRGRKVKDTVNFSVCLFMSLGDGHPRLLQTVHHVAQKGNRLWTRDPASGEEGELVPVVAVDACREEKEGNEQHGEQ